MVLRSYFKDVMDSLPDNTYFNLPVCKVNPLEIEFEDDNVETNFNGCEPPLPFANSDVFRASILSGRHLTVKDDACKAVYEIAFNIKDSHFTFKAGDTIGVIPQNDEEDVSFVLGHLDLTTIADCSYKLSLNNTQKGNKIPPHIPVKSSLRNVLKHCVDLRSVLKKLFLLELSAHTKDEKEKKILEYICSKEGSITYQTHILNRNLCLLDLFTIFKSCKPPIQVLLANLPRLLPRSYSIINSGLKEAGVLKICFSMMPLQNGRYGLTTGWLEKIVSNQYDLEKRLIDLKITNDCDKNEITVPIYLRKNLNGFSLPECLENPLILIGPGTGVAPFIGFLQERELYKDKNRDIKLGEIWLFFGCRNPNLDFIYEKELLEFVEKGVLNKLCTAYSRIENGNSKYIQDALIQQSAHVTRLIYSNATIFVCGDVKSMAASVEETFIQCLINSGKPSNEAKQVICDLKKQKKYVVDAWS